MQHGQNLMQTRNHWHIEEYIKLCKYIYILSGKCKIREIFLRGWDFRIEMHTKYFGPCYQLLWVCILMFQYHEQVFIFVCWWHKVWRFAKWICFISPWKPSYVLYNLTYMAHWCNYFAIKLAHVKHGVKSFMNDFISHSHVMWLCSSIKGH